MIQWCAYCQRFIGEKAPYDSYEISHGACASCTAKGLELSDTDVGRVRQIAGLHARLVEQGRTGDARTASAMIDSAIGSGVQPVDILVGLLSPALHQLGEAWARGEVSVADEHRFTAFAESLVELVAARTAPGAAAPGAPYPVVLVNAEGNAHTLGVRIASLWLRSRGVGTLAIYPGTPAPDLVALIQVLKPVTLGISISMPDQANAAARLVEQLQASPPLAATRIVFGGNAVKRGLVSALSGVTLATDLAALQDGLSPLLDADASAD